MKAQGPATGLQQQQVQLQQQLLQAAAAQPALSTLGECAFCKASVLHFCHLFVGYGPAWTSCQAVAGSARWRCAACAADSVSCNTLLQPAHSWMDQPVIVQRHFIGQSAGFIWSAALAGDLPSTVLCMGGGTRLLSCAELCKLHGLCCMR